TGEQDFAAEASGSDRAWFYWNANAGFLKGPAVGKLTKSQRDVSMIGEIVSAADRRTSLMGFLGSPAYPDDLTKSPYADVLPTAARGELVLHSAGADGVFLSKEGNG